jgi:cell division protein FtsI/penicillin-binding protein 2
MFGFRALLRIVVLSVVGCLLVGNLSALTTKKKKRRAHSASQTAATVTQVSTTRKLRHHKSRYSPWTEPTYADSTAGDNVDGEDLAVRRAAVEALGQFNGSVVVVDPKTGRILTMVNQRLALSGGFQPCSTIKVSVALAALQEKLVERTTKVRIYGRTSIAMTDALAHSNNYYFANLGIKLGYERVNYYARLFGYGETAGLDIAGEKPGYFPPAPPKNGGMGMLTSFGEEISQTPLELAALMSAVANGGTLYYLQYPHSQDEIDHYVPRVKRQLEIADLIPEIKPGMQGAVEYGTARRARQDDTIMGKTGTCSEGRTHLGWFGSFNEGGPSKLVVVVLLTGGRPSIGPMAAGVAGDVYRHLAEQNYFAANRQHAITPAALISTQICCSR